MSSFSRIKSGGWDLPQPEVPSSWFPFPMWIIIGTSGVTFAIVDGFSTVEASIRGRGQTVPPGKYLHNYLLT